MMYLCASYVNVHSACLSLCWCVRGGGGGCSSDSTDSRLPIIRRGEGSTEETYDESYADDREYHREDARSLSSDMYWSQHRRFAFLFRPPAPAPPLPPCLTDTPLVPPLPLCDPRRLVYHDETCKQLTPMEQGEEVEDRRGGGGGWQSPRRVFLCPSSLGERKRQALLPKNTFFATT